MSDETNWPNYVAGFADWTAIEVLDDFEKQIDAGLAGAKLVIDKKPVFFAVLQVASLNRCMGDNAIAMTRLSAVNVLLNEFLDSREAIQRVRDLHKRLDSKQWHHAGDCVERDA